MLLAAIDDSAAAGPVLAAAAMLAPLMGSQVQAINVADDGGSTARATAAAAGVSVRTVSGDPVARLREAAADADVVAIVVGTRGRPQGTRPAGHVATDLITSCEKPVVVVPPEARSRSGLRRLAVAVEGSQETSRVLVPTMRLAADANLEVVVVHVDDEASMPRFSDQPQHEVHAFAEEFLARYCPGCADALRVEFRIGSPGEEVLAACDAVNADIVVVAWSRSLEPGHARFVRHLLEHSHIPVLLVPVRPCA